MGPRIREETGWERGNGGGLGVEGVLMGGMVTRGGMGETEARRRRGVTSQRDSSLRYAALRMTCGGQGGWGEGRGDGFRPSPE